MTHPEDKNAMPHPRTILVVDDDLNVLEVLQARLASAGYETCRAASAREAIENTQQHNH